MLSDLACLIFAANIVCAQEVFLTLTRYDEQMDKMPTNVSVISSEDIEQKRAETLGDILQNETGINIREYGSSGALTSVSIRGASSKQTLVLIDGRRINDAGLGDADFSAIAASNIERVEIIRGAGAAVYGTSGFGGVINVITKKAFGTIAFNRRRHILRKLQYIQSFFRRGLCRTESVGVCGGFEYFKRRRQKQFKLQKSQCFF